MLKHEHNYVFCINSIVDDSNNINVDNRGLNSLVNRLPLKWQPIKRCPHLIYRSDQSNRFHQRKDLENFNMINSIKAFLAKKKNDTLIYLIKFESSDKDDNQPYLSTFLISINTLLCLIKYM